MSLINILNKFTDSDPRSHSNHTKFSRIMDKAIADPMVNQRLYQGLLPADLVKDKTVLDCGCYTFLSGAWSLYHGASFVTGIDISTYTSSIAEKLMAEFFSKDRYSIQKSSIEDYVAKDNDFYDIILINGTIQKLAHKHEFLEWAIQHTNYIIIEANYPSMWHFLLDKEKWWSVDDQTVFDHCFTEEDKKNLQELFYIQSRYKPWFVDFMARKFPLEQYSRGTKTSEQNGIGLKASTLYTSPGYFDPFFQYKGWDYIDTHSNYLTKMLPDYYNFPRRYCVAYKKNA